MPCRIMKSIARGLAEIGLDRRRPGLVAQAAAGGGAAAVVLGPEAEHGAEHVMRAEAGGAGGAVGVQQGEHGVGRAEVDA